MRWRFRLLKAVARFAGLNYQVQVWDSDRLNEPHIVSVLFSKNEQLAKKAAEQALAFIAEDAAKVEPTA
jgi:hypothetical protein